MAVVAVEQVALFIFLLNLLQQLTMFAQLVLVELLEQAIMEPHHQMVITHNLAL